MTTDSPVSRTSAAQQAEDLGLHGDVEGGGRLVGDQQLRLAGQRERDATRCAMPPDSWCG